MKKQWQPASAETYEILSTKIMPPRTRAVLVPREALLRRLSEGRRRKLTLLSAPAGSGKTTLISRWIANLYRDRYPVPTAWVALDEGDNDPARFWRYCITACQVFNPSVGRSALEQLHAAQRLPFEAILTSLINNLAHLLEATNGGLLVLEDYHVITEPQIHTQLGYLLDHLPATMHVVIISRSDPPLPLARLRAHDELTELHAADLRFSLAETQAFLKQALPFPVSVVALARVEERTEGWIAGLRLCTLALQQGEHTQQNFEQMLKTFGGNHRHIQEYLMAEVLSVQPTAIQDFLLQTTFLQRLTAPLCAAITGRDDCEQLLIQLEQSNLFLTSLDGHGQWYRYHALFAEAMQQEAQRRLGKEYVQALYKRASTWFASQQFLPEATELALAGQDFVQAAELIEAVINPHGMNDELHTLLRWITQLPEIVLREHPDICMVYATALLFTQDRSSPTVLARISKQIDRAEDTWQHRNEQERLSEVQALRAQIAWWQGDLPAATRMSKETLEKPPVNASLWNGANVLILAEEQLYAGAPVAAEALMLEARARFELSNNHYGVRAALEALGEACIAQGKLHQAATYYQQTYETANDDIVDKAAAQIGQANLSYEWNELSRAENLVMQALDTMEHHKHELGEHYIDKFLLIPGKLTLARILCARGAIEEAQKLLQEMVILAQERAWFPLQREVRALQARIALYQGDQVAVQRWWKVDAATNQDVVRIQQEREALIIARLYIMQHRAQTALVVLEHWLPDARAYQRVQSLIEIQTLIALAYFSLEQQSEALAALHEALMLAYLEGYQRIFLDEGKNVQQLLHILLPTEQNTQLATYIQNQLTAFAPSTQSVAEQSAPTVEGSKQTAQVQLFPIEALSPQEQRVLRLLATGRSNPEIANELVVSINTIKTQIQSIYRKLNVKNRWEAREIAQQLNLL